MTASFAVSGDTAVIEMAEADGLRRLPGGRPAPLTATTYGVGELILAALDRGVRRVVLGVGGSATTDGGTVNPLALQDWKPAARTCSDIRHRPASRKTALDG